MDALERIQAFQILGIYHNTKLLFEESQQRGCSDRIPTFRGLLRDDGYAVFGHLRKNRREAPSQTRLNVMSFMPQFPSRYATTAGIRHRIGPATERKLAEECRRLRGNHTKDHYEAS
jgi:hypothetical protein